jgi:hypothetical protein
VIIALLRLALYAALGPLLLAVAGNIAIAFAIAFGWAATDPGTGPFDVFAGFLSTENLTQSYRIGFIPMVAIGIVAVLLSYALEGWRHWFAVAFGGASISAALAWFAFVAAPVGDGINPFLFAGVAAFAGALAGLLCALIFDLIAGALRARA